MDGIVKGEQEIEWEEGFSPKSNYVAKTKKKPTAGNICDGHGSRMTHRFYHPRQNKPVLAEVVRKVKFGSGERVQSKMVFLENLRNRLEKAIHCDYIVAYASRVASKRCLSTEVEYPR